MQAWEGVVKELAYSICRSTFTDAGFSADDYATELADLRKNGKSLPQSSGQGSSR